MLQTIFAAGAPSYAMSEIAPKSFVCSPSVASRLRAIRLRALSLGPPSDSERTCTPQRGANATELLTICVSLHDEQYTPAADESERPRREIALPSTRPKRGCVVALPVSITALWPSRSNVEPATTKRFVPLAACTPPPPSALNAHARTATRDAPESSSAASAGTPAACGSMLKPACQPSCA